MEPLRRKNHSNSRRKSKKPQLRLILPDVHFPFQDPALLDAWLNHLDDLRPALTGIDILGDLMDAYTLSRFDKNPDRKTNIQIEVDEASDFLSEVRRRAGRKCDIRYSEGNHENRLRRTLWGRAPYLAPIRNLTIPALLRLKDHKIDYYTPEAPYRIGNLWILHGDIVRKSNWASSFGGVCARTVASRVNGNVIMAHTHHMSYVSNQTWSGLLEAYECGCLCHFDLEYIIGVPPWQQGWATIEIEPSGAYDVNFVRSLPIGRKRHLIYKGKTLAILSAAKAHVRV